MKITLFLYLFFLSGSILFAQEFPDMEVIKSGNGYLFGDKVHLREKASTKSKSLQVIPIGSKIKILKKEKEIFSVDGIEDNWYRVQFEKKNGFVWGGFISDFASNVDLDGDGTKELFLLRNLSNKIEKIQIRLVQDEKLISELEVQKTLSHTFSVTKLPGDQFKPKMSLFGLGYTLYSEIEGGGSNMDVFWLDDKKKLSYGFSSHVNSCDPPICLSTKMIFPLDKAKPKSNLPAGEKNRIILFFDTFDIDDDTKHEYDKEVYEWKSNKFIKVENP
jgi:hypothetical protein